MKKIFILYLITFGFLNSLQAQSVKDIVGVYSLRGGTHFLKPDQTFVLVAYATLITGKWELQEKGLVLLTPDYEKEKFTLYGRNNKNIGDSTKIMLSYGFYDDETLLHFGPLRKPVPEFKRVFKPGHRHISFPYVYTRKGNSEEVSFTYFDEGFMREGPTNPEIYTFLNKKKFNDFIGIYYAEKRDYQAFYYQYKNGRLYNDEESYSDKGDLETELNAMEPNFKSLISSAGDGAVSRDEMYVTPLYNMYDQDREDFDLNFTFSTEKNAWLNTLNYKQDEELAADYDYNKVNILFEYQKMNDFTKMNSVIKIDETPIFISPYAD